MRPAEIAMLLLCMGLCGLFSAGVFSGEIPAPIQPSAAPQGAPEDADEAATVTADLQDRLEKDLRARRPVEFEFIARVIELVEVGELPLKTVNATYLWARRQRTHPFQHFERAIRIQAAKLGVEI